MLCALITGGTSGIGAAFAQALAGEGYDLVLVARDEERLSECAERLHREHGVHVEILVADLAERDQVARVAARLEDSERPVDMLINNAGFGVHSSLTAVDTSRHEQAIDVMVRAVLILGGAAGRTMRARGRGTIINVSSVAGYITMGGYSAIKSWVTTYSESLAVELRGTGVQVTALMPGWVRTEFHERAGIGVSSIPSSLWIDVDHLVAVALKDARRGKVMSTPTLRFWVLQSLCRQLPRKTIRWVSGKMSSSRRSGATVESAQV